MGKTILITGSTDGIGLETAKALAAEGHGVLLHGRNPERLAAAVKAVGVAPSAAFVADLSRTADVERLIAEVSAAGPLDVLINNAGVFKTPNPRTAEGLDVRFMVNAVAPYILAVALAPRMAPGGRIVNLSSAAQAPVDLAALTGEKPLDDMAAYAQSKLAIAMWTRTLAAGLPQGPLVVAVNPGSLLASKMVREGFGTAGGDIGVGVDILRRAALSDAFADAAGKYFDNDAKRFGPPHPDALDPAKTAAVVEAVAAVAARLRAAA